MVRTPHATRLPGVLSLTVVITSLLLSLVVTGGSLAFAQAPAAGEKPSPFAPLLAQLASPSHNVILPKEAADQYGDYNQAEAAIGTGPFILESYERGIKLTFKRNPDYYMQGLPYVDGIESTSAISPG